MSKIHQKGNLFISKKKNKRQMQMSKKRERKKHQKHKWNRIQLSKALFTKINIYAMGTYYVLLHGLPDVIS